MIRDLCPKCGLAAKLQPPYKGSYLVIEHDNQKVRCQPFAGGPSELVHASRLKLLAQHGGVDPPELPSKNQDIHWRPRAWQQNPIGILYC